MGGCSPKVHRFVLIAFNMRLRVSCTCFKAVILAYPPSVLSTDSSGLGNCLDVYHEVGIQGKQRRSSFVRSQRPAYKQ